MIFVYLLLEAEKFCIIKAKSGIMLLSGKIIIKGILAKE